MDSQSITLFTGNANPALAHDIARHLMLPMGRASVSRFSDGEVNSELMENVRGRDVFLLQSTCPPVNENLMELLVMADACRRASAGSITAVIPYFGYARQDRRAGRLDQEHIAPADVFHQFDVHLAVAEAAHGGAAHGQHQVPGNVVGQRRIGVAREQGDRLRIQGLTRPSI